jgi:hypothetical protein
MKGHPMHVKTSAAAAMALIGALMFTGCAAEVLPAIADTTAAEEAATATPTPEPTVDAGDVVTPEQVEDLTKSGDIMAGYPVGDDLIAVKWGEPIPDAVRQAVNESVSAAAPEWGTSTDHNVSATHWATLFDAMTAEAEKLGGISLIAVSCVQSFSEATNGYRPAWVISEPGPVGEYESYQEAFDTAEAWQGGKQTGKRMYVQINNLGCAQ